MRHLFLLCLLIHLFCPCVAQVGDTLTAHRLFMEAERTYMELRDYATFSKIAPTAIAEFRKVLPPEHPRMIDVHILESFLAFVKEKNVEGLALAQKAHALAQKHYRPPHEMLATTLALIGHFEALLGRMDIAEQHMLESLKLAIAVFGADSKRLLSKYYSLSYLYIDSEQLDKALAVYDRIFYIEEKNYPPLHRERMGSYIDVAELYFRLENYQKAAYYNEKAFAIANALSLSAGYEIDMLHKNKSRIFLQQGDVEQALLYADKGYKNVLATAPELGENYNLFLEIKGDCYVKLKEYEEALRYYNDIVCIVEQGDSPALSRLIHTHIKIAQCWQALVGNSRLALHHLQKAKAYQKNLAYDDKAAALLIEEETGKFYLQQKDPVTAEPHFKAALGYAQSLYAPEHYHVVTQWYWLAKAALQKGDMALAARHLQTALRHYPTPPKRPLEQSLSPALSLKLLHLQANLLTQTYLHTHSIEHLISADSLIKNILAANETLRNTYRGQTSKLLNVADFADVYTDAVRIAMLLYQHTRQEKYIQLAYTYAEQSKTPVLTEQQGLRRFAEQHLPATTHDSLQKYQMWAEYYTTKLYEQPALRPQWEDSLQQFKQRYYQIYNRYPSSQKNTVSKIQLADVQRQLSPQQCVLEYFLSNDSCYLFYIAADKVRVITQGLPEDFDQRIPLFLNSITQYGLYWQQSAPTAAFVQADSLYRTHAIALYEFLIAPIAGELLPSVLIIPGGALSNLPFDALLTVPPATPMQFRKYAYFGNAHTIAYAYAAGMQFAQRPAATVIATDKVLAVAPLFEAASSGTAVQSPVAMRNTFTPLAFNIPEARQIQQRLGGTLLTNEQATVASFRAQAPQQHLIHLSTHAQANPQQGEYSFLVFQPTTDGNSNLLYAKDLYTIPLQAALVVLSACETGIGEWVQGEGVMSLAYGFLQAGAKSLVTTLWSINDAATLHLMQHYYDALANGKDKAAALQTAKKTYIANHNDRMAHPFFWAAYMPIGDTSPLRIAPSYSTIALVGGTAFLTAVWLYRWWRKKKVAPLLQK